MDGTCESKSGPLPDGSLEVVLKNTIAQVNLENHRRLAIGATIVTKVVVASEAP